MQYIFYMSKTIMFVFIGFVAVLNILGLLLAAITRNKMIAEVVMIGDFLVGLAVIVLMIVIAPLL
ncbi:hypothetical protein [Clostridium perfringens]|uniref:hypothetical protein n=2 Tax=Clostridium perfringens TaxID=1502 RepID=UPI00156DF368|nr:hypothetical protein [Clostridium perfringens]EGT0690949.1 hypothetical protein [Clostridium perfringens]MDK0575138.1 hypothetical protein [Clostridium perfringens]MDK0834809.1 hypothetical protein [Clostridium perfringens]MDK0838703.1 hypothetical protein [Clostridium perfringens]MDK0886700.1 hypothetical protein [Clostridium perfringens]